MKTCGSEFGAVLWRHLTPQIKTAIWMHNIPKDICKKYFLYDVWCAQTCSFRAILDHPCEIWQLLPALYSDVRKRFI